jgi:hypothetical protein
MASQQWIIRIQIIHMQTSAKVIEFSGPLSGHCTSVSKRAAYSVQPW